MKKFSAKRLVLLLALSNCTVLVSSLAAYAQVHDTQQESEIKLGWFEPVAEETEEELELQPVHSTDLTLENQVWELELASFEPSSMNRVMPELTAEKEAVEREEYYFTPVAASQNSEVAGQLEDRNVDSQASVEEVAITTEGRLNLQEGENNSEETLITQDDIEFGRLT
ncbi:MAG: hypothetical protein F6K24_50325, partial [Okeania sp. SIO2D1]|nr:hypothetical protein [Okeania sp. SIO2D1]